MSGDEMNVDEIATADKDKTRTEFSAENTENNENIAALLNTNENSAHDENSALDAMVDNDETTQTNQKQPKSTSDLEKNRNIGIYSNTVESGGEGSKASATSAIFARIEENFSRLAQRIYQKELQEVQYMAESIKCGKLTFKSLSIGKNPKLKQLLTDLDTNHKCRLNDLKTLKNQQVQLLIKSRKANLELLDEEFQIKKKEIRKTFLEAEQRKKMRMDHEYYTSMLPEPEEVLHPFYIKRQSHQDKYELSLISQYGFPSATLDGLEEEEADQDFINLGLKKRPEENVECKSDQRVDAIPVNDKNSTKADNQPQVDKQDTPPKAEAAPSESPIPTSTCNISFQQITSPHVTSVLHTPQTLSPIQTTTIAKQPEEESVKQHIPLQPPAAPGHIQRFPLSPTDYSNNSPYPNHLSNGKMNMDRQSIYDSGFRYSTNYLHVDQQDSHRL